MSKKMHRNFLTSTLLLLLLVATTTATSYAEPAPPVSDPPTLNSTSRPSQFLSPAVKFLLAGILSFAAAALSSAGGVGGGGLFLPILTIITGMDFKSASSYSAFMVTGVSIGNVACQLVSKNPPFDLDIALLSEPCMLLGVSLGVICNVLFPEWLITILFAILLTFCTVKTCSSGVALWKKETKEKGEKVEEKEEGGITELPPSSAEGKLMIPWVKLGMLAAIWFSFFVLQLIRRNRYGRGIIHVKACGTLYWTLLLTQIPLSIFFTAWILLYIRKATTTGQVHLEQGLQKLPQLLTETQMLKEENNVQPQSKSSKRLIFPTMALLAGVLGGVFGIGGGLLISPILLQIGVPPQVTAATCSVMVLFSSSMSAFQYLIRGMKMKDVSNALAYAGICFAASLVGFVLVKRAVKKHGRASLVVFSVGLVMALSTVLMTVFEAIDVWKNYHSGKKMGFNKMC